MTTLRKLARHDLSRWALVGGVAVEIHCLRASSSPSIRRLNDLDFIAAAFDCIPETLAKDFLFRHVHPLDPPSKTMLQLVDEDTSMRIDLFRGVGGIMSRTLSGDLPSALTQLISLEDAVARTARRVLDLAEGMPVPSKHADDYLRLTELVLPSDVDKAWEDHRRPTHLLRNLISSRANLLITSTYSKNSAEVCARCTPTGPFQLADANVVLSLLGYC